MARYTVIPQNAFEALELETGVLLKNFNISAATSGEAGFTDSDVVCATTGGINVSCVPTYSDFAEDVDNAPTNLKEFKHLDGWECSLSTTSLSTSPELIKLTLGAADIDGSNSSKIVPRRDLSQSDFTDLWWVGDKANGGLVAVKIMNALSTGGFSIKTGKKAKGQVTLEITGHVSSSNQSVVPMEFYSIEPASAGTWTVTFDSNEGSSVSAQTVPKGGHAIEPTPPTKASYNFAGWYIDEDLTVLWNFGNWSVDQNITLYAKWTAA